jgi:hypothetical protein
MTAWDALSIDGRARCQKPGSYENQDRSDSKGPWENLHASAPSAQRTPHWGPLTQNNLGTALATLGERESGRMLNQDFRTRDCVAVGQLCVIRRPENLGRIMLSPRGNCFADLHAAPPAPKYRQVLDLSAPDDACVIRPEPTCGAYRIGGRRDYRRSSLMRRWAPDPRSGAHPSEGDRATPFRERTFTFT